MRKFKLLALISTIGVVCLGCNPFWIDLSFLPVDESRQEFALTASELSDLLAAVSETASAFGFVQFVDVNERAPADLADGDYPQHQLLAYYKRADEMTSYSRVAIHVNRLRNSGETVVLISDRDGDSYQDFTSVLETALRDALAEALPLRRVVVMRRSLLEQRERIPRADTSGFLDLRIDAEDATVFLDERPHDLRILR